MALSVLPTAESILPLARNGNLAPQPSSWTKAAKALVSGCQRGKIHFFEERIFMKKLKSKEVSAEVRCPACEGTGFRKVKQPVPPGRRIYPAPCEKCAGKGRIART
jgi:hypothetical protein